MLTPDTSVQGILARHGLQLSPCHTARAQGFLNTVYFAQDDAGARYVLRVVRADNRDDIEGYIGRQLRLMGAHDLGAALSYRDMPAQAAFMRALAARGINVPEVIAGGDDWMLMRFVQGRNLKDIFSECKHTESDAAVHSVLNACIDVHKQGIVLWDRWGGNELIDASGTVCFIDFDIAVDFPPAVPVRTVAALDVAFLLRGCVQYAQEPSHAAAVLAKVITARADFAEVYDLAALSAFLEGQERFYDIEYCNNLEVAVSMRDKHRNDSRHMKTVADCVAAQMCAYAAR